MFIIQAGDIPSGFLNLKARITDVKPAFTAFSW